MLVSPDQVKSQGDINYNCDDVVIGAAIRTAQIFLRDVIGTGLLEKIQELVYESITNTGETPTGIDAEDNAAYKTLLDDYIQPLMIYETAVELCNRMSYKLRNFGLVKNSDINISPAQLSEILYVRDVNEVYFNDACNRLAEFLCDNAGAYPESEFDCGCKPKRKFGRTGLWLGKK